MSNLFVLNLAVADTLVSLASMPVIFLNIASSTWTFSSKVCGLFGFVTIASFISSVSSLGLIAINRYFYIVKWQTYERTERLAVGGFSLDNLSGAGIPTPPWMGGISFYIRKVHLLCLLAIRCILWLLRVFFGPLSVMALSYFKILSFTRNHKRRLATFRNRINVTKETDLARRLRMSVEETKITHTLVIVVAWAPFATTMILSVYYWQTIPAG